MQRYWTLGFPPWTSVMPKQVFTTKKEATEAAREANRRGPYKGRGVKAYECTPSGTLIAGKGK